MLRPIGAGSYGEVWLARNDLTGAYRAIKFVWSDAFENARPYEREFDAIGRFEPISRTHLGLVQVLQAGRLPNGFYYIMELADDISRGRDIDPECYTPATLAAVRWHSGAVEKAIRIGIALSESLTVLHEANLIHRDIKPSNVIFVDGQPKLADIGLVAAVSESNSVVGTNGFIAPEGQTSPKSDIFSLGKLLYEIATGNDRLEFPALPAHISEQEAILLELNQVLLKACDPNPQNRYKSVRRMREELESLEQGKSILRVRHLERALRWTRASLLTAVFFFGALFFAFQALEAKRTATSVVRERKIAVALTQGMEEVNKGDYLNALSYYAQAAAWDVANPKEHELRLGSTLMFAPRVVSKWESDSEVSCYAEGGKLLSTLQGSVVRVTDISSGAVVKEINRRAESLSTDYAGQRLAITASNTVTFYDLRDGLSDIRTFPDLVAHVSMSESSSVAVTLETGAVHLLPVNKKFTPGERELYRAILSPSGKLLAALYRDGSVNIVNTDTLDRLPFSAKHAWIAYDAAFLRNEQVLVTTSFDRTAKCWDIGTGEQIGYTMEHDGGVLYADESPDGQYLATSSLDQTVKLWRGVNFAQKSMNHTLYHSEQVVWVKFVGDDSVLSHCDDGSTWLWSLSQPVGFREEKRFTIKPPNKLVTKTDKLNLSAAGDTLTGAIGRASIKIKLGQTIETFAVNPQGTLIAIGTRDTIRTPHSVVMFDFNGRRVGKEMAHRDGITFVTFSPAGELLVSCSEDFTARVWDKDGNPVTPNLKHKDQVRWASFHKGEEWVVTGSYDRTVRIWNSRSGLAITPPIPVGNIVDYVEFRSGTELFVSNTRRNYILTLDIFKGAPQTLLESIAVPSDALRSL